MHCGSILGVIFGAFSESVKMMIFVTPPLQKHCFWCAERCVFGTFLDVFSEPVSDRLCGTVLDDFGPLLGSIFRAFLCFLRLFF